MSATGTKAGGRIVVGVDGSDSSNAAVEWAAGQAELVGAELELVTAWMWPTTYGAPVPLPEGFEPQAGARTILEETEQWVHRQHPGLTVRATTAEGHPAAVLVEASKGAALLVVGSRGHGAFVGMVLGSVSEHCVTNAHCPVLVLRTK